MTDSQPNETTEYPVVLGWHMPTWARALLVALVFVIAVAAMFVVATLTSGVPRFTQGGLGIVAVVLWLRFAVHLLTAFECMSPGMNIQVVFGEVTGVRWEEVQSLKLLARPLVLLRLQKKWYLFLGLPEPVQDQLIALLREASNARIVGFDDGS